MAQHIIFAAKLFGERVLFNIITLIMIPVFIPIIGSFAMGPILFSLMVCSLYLGIAADTIWKLGKHDRQSYATEKHYKLKGLVVGLCSELPFFLLYINLLFRPGSSPARALYRLSIGPFMGFVPEDRVTIGYGLVLLIIPLWALLFYLVGYYRRPNDKKDTLSHKILYKDK